ncbi:MmgE/PrpD family protein [Halorubrum kocurii]|uniref:MmgE/PrpD family protein n=1 Tax=Halorubrum kocurii JCM 14978 TaxID=1230456 RepID=M0P6V8_9EURY|nr:MmgE/PrpD family protein [Halorubrum kocurii]EMA65892.1 MmgE/PrpD family protein [Halorubrum kocurii JCM 14978]
MAPEPERELATFAAELETGAIPDRVRDRAGLTIADTLGAIVAGSTDDAVGALARRWTDGVSGGATVLGADGGETVPPLAALCNGAAGTVLELDEGHRFAAGHPAIHVLPALLADAEIGYGDSDAFVRSFVAGYEVAVRTARALGALRSGYHPHGVWGAVGGAAAVARSRGLDPGTTRSAMAIAANYAQHTRFEAATEGATVRNAYAGMSNLAALVAVDQAEAGFGGLENGVARHLEHAAENEVDAPALAADLGDRWELEHGYFKIHAACRYTHPALDAVAALPDGVDPTAVESVRVETYPAAARLTEPRPRNQLQAKFSIPFAVATALLRGDSGPPAFADEAITPEAIALAERVTVAVDDEIAARAPEQRGARVTVETADDRLSREVVAPRGGEHDPFDEARLESKFRELVAPVIGEDRAATLWESARAPEPPRVLCTLARR